MQNKKRPLAFWFVMAFLVFDLLFFLIGQTGALFAYNFTVRMGLQESVQAVGEYGVKVNRSFGLADTVIGIPLMLISLAGLHRRKRWALTTLAAFMGITIYWPVFCATRNKIFVVIRKPIPAKKIITNAEKNITQEICLS